MILDDDSLHRILLSLEFKERHALAGISKQFAHILSSRKDVWENDAEFVVTDPLEFELCARWMRTRWFRHLRIRIGYSWRVNDEPEDRNACDTFFNFLIAFAPRLHHLDISAPYEIWFRYTPLVNASISLISLKLHVYALERDMDLTDHQSLQILDVETRHPTRSPNSFTLRALKTLSIKSKTVYIEKVILPSLERLCLDGAHSASLPSMLGDSTTLTSLSLRRCNLVEIPDFLSILTSLKHLRASHNSLTSISGLPPNLTLLDVSHNQCAEFAEEHKGIEILDISCNPCIVRLETMNLPNLKSVTCSAIPTQAFLSRSTNLQTIHIHEPCCGYGALDFHDPRVPPGHTTSATRLIYESICCTNPNELANFTSSNPHLAAIHQIHQPRRLNA